MDPRNGAVLAIVSRPAFNPNLFATGISVNEWKKISDNPYHPMDNKPISGEYPPGSTFKIVTGLAALEAGKVTPEEQIFDSGQHWLIPKGNADGEALGWLNFFNALAKSDNVYFYEMGNRLGIDNLERYARIFGFGALTGINLPGESEGLVASKKYKEKVFQEDWYLAETFDAAIGQGFQLATPLQIAVMMSSVANGGTRYQPYLVNKIVSDQGQEVQSFSSHELGKLPFKSSYMQLVQQALRGVAQEGGTAAQLANFPVSIAGKTGTAENSHGKDHGWFVCYAPFENPEIVVVVMVEQGGYGTTAGVPIAKKILEAAFHIGYTAPPASVPTQTAVNGKAVVPPKSN
jgi:penicillin-binding protein 2